MAVKTENSFTAAQEKAFRKAVQENMSVFIRDEARRLAHLAVKRYIKEKKKELDVELRKLVKKELDGKLPELVKDYLDKTVLGSYDY